MSSSDSEIQANKRNANIVSVLTATVLSSALFTFGFGFRFLYAVGLQIDGESNVEAAFPAWVQAGFIAVLAYAIVTNGSRLFRRYVVLSTIEAAVHCAMKARHLRHSRDARTRKPYTMEKAVGMSFVKFIWMFIGMFVGVSLGTLAVFLFGGLRIKYMQNSILREGTTDFTQPPNATQLARAFVIESLFAIVLVLTTYFGKMRSMPTEMRQSHAFWFYGRLQSIFWFVYMFMPWVHTRLTVDAIRGAVFCFFAGVQSDTTAQCSALSAGYPITLFWTMLGVYVLIPLIAVIVIYNVPHRRAKMKK